MPIDPIEMPEDSDPQYQSYLLRLWQESRGGEQRVLLQDVLSGKPRSFPSLERLFNYLAASRQRPEEREDAGPR